MLFEDRLQSPDKTRKTLETLTSVWYEIIYLSKLYIFV